MLAITLCICTLIICLFCISRRHQKTAIELACEKEKNIAKNKENSILKRDIKTRTTNLEKALQKAEEANRLKSLFLANMSHEIRTPLNSIMGFSELIIDHQYDDQSKEIFSKQIEHNSRHLLNLMDQIFHLSVIETGRINIDIQEIDLKKMLEKLKTKTIETIKHYNKDIEFKLQAHPGYILYSDKAKVKLILKNLLNNAIKFTDSGQISLSCTRLSDMYLFEVSDTGCGLREDEYERIFDPFTQGSETLKKTKGGSGLGLANVKNYVILLGGKVWCEKNTPHGSVFSFTLPLPSNVCQIKNTEKQYSLFNN